MGEVIVVICSFNNELLFENLASLPTLDELAECYWLAYAGSTWTIPGTTAILTQKQEWENPTSPEIAWSNVKWGHWDKLQPDTGSGDAQRLVDEWDGEGTAFLFYRLLHYPYGMPLSECMQAVRFGQHNKLRKAYIQRLTLLDNELTPLLQLRSPIIVVGDHGEDWTNTKDVRYLHHHNPSDAVLRVPLLAKNVDVYLRSGALQTKDALRVARGQLVADRHIIIASEGPLMSEWLFVHYDTPYKFVLRNDSGINVYRDGNLVYHGLDAHVITTRLRQLGYL